MPGDPPLFQKQTVHTTDDDETKSKLQGLSSAIEISTQEKPLDHSNEVSRHLDPQPVSTEETRTGRVKRTTLDPITPDIQLTPRQQRALAYLSRRRMRNARIRKRMSLDDDGAAIPGDQAISTSQLIPLKPLPPQDQHPPDIQSKLANLEIPPTHT